MEPTKAQTGCQRGAPQAMSTATWKHTNHKAGPDAGPGRFDNPARIPRSIFVVDSVPRAVSKCDIPARIPRPIPVAESEPKTVSVPEPQFKKQLEGPENETILGLGIRDRFGRGIRAGMSCFSQTDTLPKLTPAGPPHVDLRSHLHCRHRQADRELSIPTSPADPRFPCPFLSIRLGEGFGPTWPIKT